MTLHTGDCLDVMAQMPAASVDAIVTDPPYGLEFMGKEWDRLSADPNIGRSRRTGFDRLTGPPDKRPGHEGGTWFGSREGAAPNYTRTTNAKCRNCGKWRVSGGHDGKGNTLGCKCEQPDFPNVQRDAGLRMAEWHQRWATEALRVAKPGAYLLAFGGTRTYHRLACAIEDAGWLIRDCLVWAYAQGFPKGRANLKPAWEPIVMARKPGPLRELAIDACRIEGAPRTTHADGNRRTSVATGVIDYAPPLGEYAAAAGRWPANVILTDPIFDGGVDGVVGGGSARASGEYVAVVRGERSGPASIPLDNGPQYTDSGTYSRFFLIPKADRAEREPLVTESGRSTTPTASAGRDRRNASALHQPGQSLAGDGPTRPILTRQFEGGPLNRPDHLSSDGYQRTGVRTPRRNHHPTVKPLDLMRHLVRLVTPPGGTVLDPFLGSGTTAIAAEMEGFAWIGIEREAEYVAIAEARLQGVQRGLGLSA